MMRVVEFKDCIDLMRVLIRRLLSMGYLTSKIKKNEEWSEDTVVYKMKLKNRPKEEVEQT